MKHRAFSSFVLAIVFLVTSFELKAEAVGLIISGTVRDAAGAPIQGAWVSDGNLATYSDALGRYSLSETFPGTYYVEASKASFVSSTRVVNTATNLSDVDFSLKFIINPIIQRYVTTLPATLTVEATSLAPSTTDVTATLAGSSVPLSYVGLQGSFRLWRGTHTLASTTAQGNYTMGVSGSIGGSIVTNTPTTPYTVDTIKPMLDTVSPVRGGNVFGTSLRFAGRTEDTGAGIDPTSTSITLTDVSAAGSPQNIPSSYDSANGAYFSNSVVALTELHQYSAVISLSDRAGNTSTKTVEFLSTYLDADAATPLREAPTTRVAITEPAAAEGGTVCNLGTCTWTFKNFEVLVYDYLVTLGGSNHAGYGALGQQFSLTNAKVSYELANGQTVSDVPVADVLLSGSNSLRDRVVYQQVDTFSQAANQTLSVGATPVLVTDALDVRLAQGVSNVELSMQPSNTTFVGAEDVEPPCRMEGDVFVCDPPSPPNPPHQQCVILRNLQGETEPMCNPDYLVYFVSDDEAAKMLQREQDAAASISNEVPNCDATCRGEIALSYANPLKIDSDVIEVVLHNALGVWLDPYDIINRSDPNLIMEFDQNTVEEYAGTYGVDSVAALAYLPGYPVVLPAHINAMCTFALSCEKPEADEAFSEIEVVALETNAQAAPAANDSGEAKPFTETKEQCVKDGGRTVYEGKNCRQTIKLAIGNQGGRPYTIDNRRQKFFTWVIHGRGMRNQQFDTLGMAWHPNPQDGAWKTDGSAWRGGKWRRAQQTAQDNNHECVARYTNDTWWNYGSLSTEAYPSAPSDFTGYGRKVWQGNTYTEGCPEGTTGGAINVQHRLVEAHLWMSLREDVDHSYDAQHLKSGQPAAHFTHMYSKWDWQIKWPCPVPVKKGPIPLPCPWPREKTKSWEVGPLIGKQYWW